MKYPTIRNLDGVYYRILRNGTWLDICYSDLTPEERKQCTQKYTSDQLRRLAERLADSLHHLGDSLNIIATFSESDQ